MAPIVLVHGINSGPEEFDQFEPVLTEAGMPSYRVRLGDGTVDTGAHRLRSQIIEAGMAFGVNHVHIVAKSKGGLWSRRAISSLPIRVYTLTTLDTPHRGSVLADALVALGTVAVEAPNPLIALRLLPLASSVRDLTIALVQAFNTHNPLRTVFGSEAGADSPGNIIEYTFFASDANLNRDLGPDGYGVIQPEEATYQGQALDPFLYRFLQSVRRVDIEAGEIRFAPTELPRPLNDFVVTTESAWCLPVSDCIGSPSTYLVRLAPSLVPWQGHHGNVTVSAVARMVRDRLGVHIEKQLEF